MIQDSATNLARHRLERAHECLSLASVAIGLGFYKGAVNRTYYAVFHSMRAVLALDSIEPAKKHSGVIAEIRQFYIKTRKLPASLSDIIDTAFKMRQNCDYTDYYAISKPETLQQYENAREFLNAVEEYINGIDNCT